MKVTQVLETHSEKARIGRNYLFGKNTVQENSTFQLLSEIIFFRKVKMSIFLQKCRPLLKEFPL